MVPYAQVFTLHIPYLCGDGPGMLPSGCPLLVPHGHLVHFFRKCAATEPLAQIRLLRSDLAVVPVQSMQPGWGHLLHTAPVWAIDARCRVGNGALRAVSCPGQPTFHCPDFHPVLMAWHDVCVRVDWLMFNLYLMAGLVREGVDMPVGAIHSLLLQH